MQGGSDAVGQHDPGDAVGRHQRGDAPGKRRVRECGVHGAGARFAQGTRGVDQRAARGAKVVQHDHLAGLCLADHAAARDYAARAALLDEYQLDVLVETPFEQLAEDLGALDAADVRRRDRNRRLEPLAGEVIDEHRQGGEEIGRHAEGIVECGGVMHVQRNQAGDGGRLEELGDVARIHRVAGLRAAVLARKCEIRHKRDNPRRARIAQAEQQEQEAHEPLRDP